MNEKGHNAILEIIENIEENVTHLLRKLLTIALAILNKGYGKDGDKDK